MHCDERFKAVGAERVVAAPLVPRRSKEGCSRLIVVAYFARVVVFVEPLVADMTVVLEQGQGQGVPRGRAACATHKHRVVCRRGLPSFALPLLVRVVRCLEGCKPSSPEEHEAEDEADGDVEGEGTEDTEGTEGTEADGKALFFK